MVYLVIPVFNRKEFTKNCLLSLRQQTYQDFKVIVTDDGSTDGTGEMLKNDFPEVIVLQGDGNLFWTAATNMGIEYALKDKATTHVMTLNNDTLAPEDFMEKMMYWAKQKPNAVLGAFAIESETQKPVYGGEIMHWAWNRTTHLLDTLPKEQQKGLQAVTYFPGRGMLIPVKVFEKIGLFDVKRFPHYYADYDFSNQARVHGFEMYCNYDAKISIYPEASGDRQNRKQKNLKNYKRHLFDIRGGGNLGNFTRFTLKNCPTPYIPYHLLNGYTRRLLGYFLK